jgi:hypothetical protein
MITMSIGTVLGAVVVAGVYFGRLRLSHTLLAFITGAMLAGSAVGLIAQRAAQTGAQVVQQTVTAVKAGTGPTPAPAPPRRAVRKP